MIEVGPLQSSEITTAQFLNDVVMRDGLADHWRESYVAKADTSIEQGMTSGVAVGPEANNCHLLIIFGSRTAAELSNTYRMLTKCLSVLADAF
jgi:hypothetical protein